MSPPPVRAATSTFLISLAKSLPRLASTTAFLCLVVAHLERPLIDPPGSVVQRAAHSASASRTTQRSRAVLRCGCLSSLGSRRPPPDVPFPPDQLLRE